MCKMIFLCLEPILLTFCNRCVNQIYHLLTVVNDIRCSIWFQKLMMYDILWYQLKAYHCLLSQTIRIWIRCICILLRQPRIFYILGSRNMPIFHLQSHSDAKKILTRRESKNPHTFFRLFICLFYRWYGIHFPSFWVFPMAWRPLQAVRRLVFNLFNFSDVFAYRICPKVLAIRCLQKKKKNWTSVLYF